MQISGQMPVTQPQFGMNKTLRSALGGLAGLAAASILPTHAARAQAPEIGQEIFQAMQDDFYSPQLFGKLAADCRNGLHGVPGTVYEPPNPDSTVKLKALPCFPAPPRKV